MQPKPLSVEDLRDLINKGEAKDPLVFLEAVMSGQDPRRLSSIYELICEIDNFTDGDLSKSDWSDIVHHVTSRYKYHTVSLRESIAASKTLAEYLHSKRKQVDIYNHQDGGDPSNHPLTVEEVELFRERFNNEF